MRCRVFFFIISLFLLLSTAGFGQEVSRGGDAWTLWAGGTTQMRGANIYQRRVYPELDGPTFMGSGPLGPPFTQADFDALASMGANYVNISHTGLYTEEPPFVLDPDVKANLDTLLAMAQQADLFVVISFRTGPGRSEFTFFLDEVGTWFDESYLNDTVWEDSAAQDAWVAMWRETAELYRDNPVVVGYDLMVEPNADALVDEWDPDTFYATYGGTLRDWNQLYPRIVEAIRSVDTSTPILVQPLGYGAVEWLPWMDTVNDARTVYTVHQYSPHEYTHQDPRETMYTYPGFFDTDGDGENETFDLLWLEDLLGIIDTFQNQHAVPVAVNEFGVMRWVPGAASFMTDQMALFDAKGVNYAFWEWACSWQEFAEEVDAFNFRHGPDPYHHQDVSTSDLIEAIRSEWSKNTLRPSTFTPTRRHSRPFDRP